MVRRAKVLALAALITAPFGGALADPAYTASDILAHFSPAEKPVAERPVRTRSLCVGTASECGRPVAAASDPVRAAAAATPFDLKVNFNYNSGTLTGPARSNLDEFAKALKDPRLANSQFVVEGHTDGAGSEAFNLALSQRRAKAVVGYLASRGVQTRRLEARGYGKQRPIAPDPLASENRRVEAKLKGE